ncbi:hypothetical protein FHS56_000486 [Thermonema lapsum]|uniref:Alpha-2-macroglobulin bait region domain-containing protein n=1 Tax=Thermonema lapsum TaxID=28195 RepID=A0A846MNL5_9BACT|nr:hypothetical protein [Thermonema lapsum]NIK73000.1 hypothetical protein [Thermonema lapsum]
MRPRLHLICLLFLFAFMHIVWAQNEPIHHRQQFTIRAFQLNHEDVHEGKRFIKATFDCSFKFPIKDLSHSRYKFYAVIKEAASGKVVYKNPKNYVAALATESFSQPGKAFAEGLILRVPHNELTLPPGKNSLIFELHALSGEFENPKDFGSIYQKPFSIEKEQGKRSLDFAEQSFSFDHLLLQADAKSGTKGFNVRFNLKAAHPHDAFLAPDRPAEAGTFLVGLIITDSSGQVVFQTNEGERWFERWAKIQPIENPKFDRQIIEEIELFVPYERLRLEPGNHQVNIQVVAYNFDRSHRYKAGEQSLIVFKPKMYPYSAQEVNFSRLSVDEKQKKQGLHGLVVSAQGSFRYGYEVIKGAGSNPALAYYCLYATLETEDGQLLYEPRNTPDYYFNQATSYHYLITKPSESMLHFSGDWLIPYKDIDLPQGKQEAWLVLHLTDLQGKVHKKVIHRQKISFEQPARYRVQTQQSRLILRPYSAWSNERHNIPAYPQYIRKKAPNVFVQAVIGKDIFGQSVVYPEASEVPAQSFVTYAAEGDALQWQIWHADPSGQHMLLTVYEWTAQNNHKEIVLNQGVAESGSLKIESKPAIEVMARNLTLSPTFYQEVQGYEVSVVLRTRNFDESQVLLFVDYEDSTFTGKKNIPYIHLIKGKAKIQHEGYELEAGTGEWKFFLPLYAVEEGKHIRVALKDKEANFMHAMLRVPLPATLPSTHLMRVDFVDSRKQKIEGTEHTVLRFHYEMPDLVLADWGTSLRLYFRLLNEDKEINDMITQTQPVSEAGEFRPKLTKGYFEIYIPTAKLCELKPAAWSVEWKSNLRHEAPKMLKIENETLCMERLAQY